MEYSEFLKTKSIIEKPTGKDVPLSEISPVLYDFQRDIVRWALRRGRAAIFAGTGLGKTLIQLEWARHVVANEDNPLLIVAPLAVAAQTQREANKLDLEVTICRKQRDVKPGVNITNYEMLRHFNPDVFCGVVLDESSILKSYMGKTKRQLISMFRGLRWKLACTATPAPNDHMELGNHAEFLEVMFSNEMLARWFINDASEAGNYRLKGHAESDFWRWVASWAVALTMPSDIGYNDDGFVLPPLHLHQHIVESELPPPDGMLFRFENYSATDIHAEMRLTANDRAARVAELVAEHTNDHWLVWCNTNYEADALKRTLPDAEEIRGSESISEKERKLMAFSNGEIRLLITKPSIAGHGLNWQHCSHVAFVGLSYSFEQYYQAIRRTYRYGQKRPVNCHIVCAQSETGILSVIERKEQEFKRMHSAMVEAMAERSKHELRGGVSLVVNHETDACSDESFGWQMTLGDCVTETAKIPDDSIGLSVFSPPFSNLYIYSDALADMGNSSSDGEFMEHFSYLMEELYRVTIPGRIAAIHCKDLPLYKGRDGAAGLRDFPGAIIRMAEQCGWTYHSRVTIWKCPVTEMTRTKNHGLLYKQLRKNSSASRQGMADYIVAFRAWKGQEFDNPVTHTFESFPLERWQRWASPVWDLEDDKGPAKNELMLEPSPVWDDIRQFDVLNYKLGKDEKDEKHICPLQLDVIERCIRLWSNAGDLVFSPFAGIGSEGYVAVKLGRRFHGIELKRSYYDLAIKHLKTAAAEQSQNSLFSEKDAQDV